MNNSNNPFDMFKQLGQFKYLEKVLGDGFFKNLPLQNIPGFTGEDMAGGQGMQGMPFDKMFPWSGNDTFPKVDIYQQGHEVVAVIELPGLERQADVVLALDSDRLFVRGTIPEHYQGAAPSDLLVAERQRGNFERELQLPVRVVPNKVQAQYKNGLLTVRMIREGGSERPHGNVVPISFD